jgi:hypothetical protein
VLRGGRVELGEPSDLPTIKDRRDAAALEHQHAIGTPGTALF